MELQILGWGSSEALDATLGTPHLSPPGETQRNSGLNDWQILSLWPKLPTGVHHGEGDNLLYVDDCNVGPLSSITLAACNEF